jgi:HD-like signal output (HDOD) protein
MPKSAQQKFSEYLDESRETSYAINELVRTSNEATDGYAYAAGFLSSVLQEAIAELPKARRADFRNRLLNQAQKHSNEMLITAIKES